MSHSLTLQLVLLDQQPDVFAFRLSIRNESPTPLLLPTPRALGLRFRDAHTGRAAKLHLDSEFRIAENWWEGFTLQPGEMREIILAVGTRQGAPRFHEGCGHCDESWRVELEAGEYEVTYRYRMDPDGYHLDSQYDPLELRKKARVNRAEVWVGEAVSNSLRIAFEAAPSTG